jgi:hypothetical protein
MTDNELLGKAAKAIGMGYVSGHAWNPLTDDGDALRLAVKLKMGFSIWDKTAVVANNEITHEPHGDDPYAATRRVIVRAAAAIGSAK